MSMRNIIYKRIDNVTKSELLNFFEFEHMSMSPYINYYTYKEYEKECRLDHFHHAISTEILLKNQVISNILCKPNGLLLYVGQWYIISLDVLSQIFGDDLRVGVMTA